MTQVPVWVAAFCTAVFLALVGTPLLRRLALATDLVDKPGQHKSHHVPTAYLGGVSVVVSVLAGLALEFHVSFRVAAVAFAAAVLGAVGLLDDDRTVDPRYRFVAQFAAAVVAVAAGVRINATGVASIDIALTLVWIVGVTNAFNLLDNMDGLTAGVAAMATGAVFSLAVLAQQPVTMSLAAAVLGACIGFLVYNRPPASIFLGDAGSLFLGFVIAILTVDVTPALAPPFGFVVPFIILGLPVLDTTTVTLARLRRGRSITVGGRDHLSHRLVARGLSRGRAVIVLVGVQAILSVLAVLAGRRVLQLRWAAIGVFGVLAALTFVTTRAQVYSEPVLGFPRKLKLAVLGLAVAAPLLSLPALLAVAEASSPARTGAAVARQALEALTVGDGARAAAEFDRAGRYFAQAEEELSGLPVSAAIIVPIVGSNLQATRTLVSTGRRLSTTGSQMAGIVDGSSVRIDGGSVNLDELRSLAGDLSRASAVLHDAHERLSTVDRPFLLPPLQSAVRELNARVVKESKSAEQATRSAQLLPAILGDGGARRYFLAFQNNAEIRGGGGFLGNWGELVAEDGHLELGRFGRSDDLNSVNFNNRKLDMPFEFKKRWIDFQPHLFWQQVNISPDFPTTANIIGQLYPQSGGQPLDGVIAIDPVGLSALLELTGPVNVTGWPEPVSATNVVDITLRTAYERFGARPEREQFLGDLSRTVAQAFTTVDLGSPVRVAQALSRAAGQGHLLVHLNRPAEQGLVTDLGVEGAIEKVKGDSVMVVNQNVSANKLDYYLRRRLRYGVTLDPGRNPATVTGRLELTLENGAPASGLPEAVIGPAAPRFVAGENRSYVSLYSPFPTSSVSVDGQPVAWTSDPDLGRLTHSTTVSIPARSSRTLVMEVQGEVQLTADGWYRLDLLHQPTLRPDDTQVSVTVVPGWRVAETRGADPATERQAEARLEQDRPHTIWVRVERTSTWTRVWDRLRGR